MIEGLAILAASIIVCWTLDYDEENN